MLKRVIIFAAFLLLFGCQCETEPQKIFKRVVALVERVREPESFALSEDELIQFSADLDHLNIYKIAEAMALLDGETFSGLGSSTMQEKSWGEPARLMINEIISRKPNTPTLQKLIFKRPGAWEQSNMTLVYQMGLHHPEYTWAFVKEHREIVMAILGEWDKWYDLSHLTFGSMERRSDKIGRTFLLDGSYRGESLAKCLPTDALSGMAYAAPDEDSLIDLLEWRLGSASSLTDNPDFQGNALEPWHRSTFDALKALAERDPQKAISWARKNDHRLDFKWHFHVFSGWVKRDDLTDAELIEALEWLLSRNGLNYSELDYLDWNIHPENGEAFSLWFKEPGKTPLIETIKNTLRQKYAVSD